jgi:hypothetical protein
MDWYLLLTPQMTPVVLHVLHYQLINATDRCAFDTKILKKHNVG